MARYWLGPWVWNDGSGGGLPGWQSPAGALASLDMRNDSACAATVTPSGFGLFVTANATALGSDYTNLGTDPTATWTQQQINRWASALALPQTPAGTNLRQLAWETLTIQSDPTGVDRCRPIVPTAGTPNYELWLAGQLARSKLFNVGDPEATPLIDLLKRIYRQVRQDSLDGLCLDAFGQVDGLHYRKVLGYWVRKFRANYRNFQPADLPDEPDLPPTTMISENFNQADSSTVGPQLTWNEVQGPWSTVSNQLSYDDTGGAADGRIRAESDLSSSDNYGQIDITAVPIAASYGAGVCARYSSGGDTCYQGWWFADGNAYFSKIVSGTRTNLTSAAQSLSVPVTVKITCNGSSLKLTWAGSDIITLTDSSIASGTRAGVFGYQSGGGTHWTYDNFQAADLAAAVGSPPLSRRSRRVNSLLRM